MTDEAQRIAIAEACYGQVHPANKDYAHARVWSKEHDGLIHAPDYLSDLNACHEMEKVLTTVQKDYYASMLGDNCGSSWRVFATAPQRCEAFLRTLGKLILARTLDRMDSTG